MIELHLFRHGETVANTEQHLISGRNNDTPLTELGVEQSLELGEALLMRALQPDFVYASPAVRTIDTARFTLLAMGLHIEPMVDDRLQEMDMGLWTGQDRAATYTAEMITVIERMGKDFAADEGESMNDVGDRMLAAVTEIAERHDDQADRVNVFIFGHGVAIRCLASTIDDWSRQQTFETVTPNTSETRLTYDDGLWHVDYVGQQAHDIHDAVAR